MIRTLGALAAASLILTTALVAPTGAEETTPTELAHVADPAWLASTYDALATRHGERFLDVGYAATPSMHVAVLFDGPVPTGLGELHAALPTVGYDVSDAIPLTHEPVVPLMKLAAQQVPDRIQPGAWMAGPHSCTFAHVVEDTAGTPYILTAGHCVDFVGQPVSLLTRSGAIGTKTTTFGQVLAFENAGVGGDYALVSIEPAFHSLVDPNMVGWNGPTGIADAPESGLVKHYGFGAATWQTHATRCRLGATGATFWGQASYAFFGHVLWGDSGSGAHTGTGKALGINTHLNLNAFAGNNAGTRATHAIAQLEAMTGLDLDIVDGAPVNEACQVV